MPRSRPPLPFKPKPTAADLERARALRTARWRHEQSEAWCDAVVAESWRLVYAEGGRCCGREEFDRGARSLMAQGMTPPPGEALD